MKTNAMKANAVIIGSGNIGTDLMMKALRSESLNPMWMVGIDEQSAGLAMARDAGLQTTHLGIDDFIERSAKDNVRIAFDATSAYVHAENSQKLLAAGIRVVDMTPAAIGPFCVPPVNLESHLDAPNVNMVTCGGQATIPLIYAVSRVHPVVYGEIIATIASKSAGPGTRMNIDEFTRTTAGAIESVGRAEKGKAIIILNPAEPPLMMRDTVHCMVAEDVDEQAVKASIDEMIRAVQEYVPGYKLVNGPVIDGRRVSIFIEVEGRGDYLAKYAGNLDIMTASALRTAELMAAHTMG